MIKKIGYYFLFLLFFLGCGDDTKELKDLVKDEIIENKPGKKITWKKDGKEMVLIPAGSFEMGDHFSEGEEDELPVHKVALDAFYMDIHEVTVGQYREFVNQSEKDFYDNWDEVAKYSPGDDYPMIRVTWNDATAYAEWAGKRLPTEAEWEYAARGGLAGKRYPWGDELTHDDANHLHDDANHLGVDDGYEFTAPVGSFAANGYGLYDMAGNVSEWCQDFYGRDYYDISPINNPTGPEDVPKQLFGDDNFGQKPRVFRGGDWHFNSNNLRLAGRRNGPDNLWSYGYGFRCVLGSN